MHLPPSEVQAMLKRYVINADLQIKRLDKAKLKGCLSPLCLTIPRFAGIVDQNRGIDNYLSLIGVQQQKIYQSLRFWTRGALMITGARLSLLWIQWPASY